MHRHADLMLEYAQDAAKTDKPWELWEARPSDAPTWKTLADNPIWRVSVEYRRKPRQITLSVPKAETKAPEYDTPYFWPNTNGLKVTKFMWVGDNADRRILENGILYLNEDDAQAAVDALKTLFKGESQ